MSKGQAAASSDIISHPNGRRDLGHMGCASDFKVQGFGVWGGVTPAGL